MKIHVEGFQWEWTFLYVNEGIFVSGKTASEEAPQQPAQMYLPVDEPVEIDLTSRDVIHSFFVPDLLFKRDAIPGRMTSFTFTPTVLGTFHAQCAEFCGLFHSKMTFDVHVVSPPDYSAWILQERKAAASVTVCAHRDSPDAVAHNISWNTNCLAVPAEQPFTVSVTNEDDGIEHNFSIYDSFFEKKTYFTSPKLTGPASETLNVGGLPPGHYYFQCDVHGPAMSGSFVVAAPDRTQDDDGGHGMAVKEAPTAALAPEPERGRFLDWLTTTDHKKIGILYLINSFAFFAVGGRLRPADADRARPTRDADLRPACLQPAVHAARHADDLPGRSSPCSRGSGTTSCPCRSARSTWRSPDQRLVLLAVAGRRAHDPVGLPRPGRRRRGRMDRLPTALRTARHGPGPVDRGADHRRHRVDPGRASTSS